MRAISTAKLTLDYVVVFDVLLSERDGSSGLTLRDILAKDHGFVEVKRFWNSHWNDDPRRIGDVVVLGRRELYS